MNWNIKQWLMAGLSVITLIAVFFQIYSGICQTVEEYVDQEIQDQIFMLNQQHQRQFDQIIEQLKKDTLFLAKLPSIEKLIQIDNQKNQDVFVQSDFFIVKNGLESLFKNFLYTNESLYQARLIRFDEVGQELVRVGRLNGQIDVRIASNEELQPKSHRDYYTHALKLPKYGLGFSEINLNREQGQLEIPLRPTIRSYSPVGDDSQAAYGMVILNYDLGDWIRGLNANYAPIQTIQTTLTGPGEKILVIPEKTHHLGFVWSLNPKSWFEQYQPSLQIHTLIPNAKIYKNLSDHETFLTLTYPLKNPWFSPELTFDLVYQVPMTGRAALIELKFWSYLKQNGVFIVFFSLFPILGLLYFIWKNLKNTRKYNQDLKTEIALKTEHLEQSLAEMEVSKNQLQNANLAKNQFMANIGHEIRTPMNAILGMTQLLMTTDVNEEQESYLNQLNGASEAMLKMLNDILDFGKLESGHYDLKENPFTVVELLNSITPLFKNMAQEKGIELIFDVSCNIPQPLIGDVNRINQILVNLISNAIKFTSQGFVKLAIYHEPIQGIDHAIHLLISVEDSGIGIPQNQLDLIFEPFRQSDSNKNRNYGGTGLGLNVCQKLVHLMKGSIRVESTLNVGSTFYCQIELGCGTNQSEKVGSELKDMTALVVEDVPTMNHFMHLLLTHQWEMKADYAYNAKEALECFSHAERSYQVVLLDWKLPDMMGDKVVREIRRIERLKKQVPTRIVLITAYSKKVGEDLKKEGLIDDVLTKPVIPLELLEILVFLRSQKNFILPPSEPRIPNPIEKLENSSSVAVNDPHIMVVEDMLTNQVLILNYLRKAGFVGVDVAENGQQAVEMAKQKPYDLILMDVQMPVMDGIEATCQIRSLSGYAQTPIIVVTASPEDLQTYPDYSPLLFTDYVNKPINMKEFHQKLHHWLSESA